jgi:hypothetical protein
MMRSITAKLFQIQYTYKTGESKHPWQGQATVLADSLQEAVQELERQFPSLRPEADAYDLIMQSVTPLGLRQVLLPQAQFDKIVQLSEGTCEQN